MPADVWWSPCSGHLRRATGTDEALLVTWWMTFSGEALLPDDRGGEAWARRVVAALINEKRLWVWEDGRACSMAGWSGKGPHGVRIMGVFTPPAFRGRGCAATWSSDSYVIGEIAPPRCDFPFQKGGSVLRFGGMRDRWSLSASGVCVCALRATWGPVFGGEIPPPQKGGSVLFR